MDHTYQNNLRVAQRQNELRIERLNKLLKNLEVAKVSDEVRTTQRDKILAQIAELNDQNTAYVIEQKNPTGLQEDITKATKQFHDQQQYRQQKKRDMKQERESVKQNYYDRLNSGKRAPSQYEIANSYKYVNRVTDTLPNYMATNLAEMPNNKGYIWRGIYFFGHQEAVAGEPTIIFEKMRGGVLRIHEYTATEYRLYEKVKKDRRKLINRKRRVCKTAKNLW